MDESSSYASLWPWITKYSHIYLNYTESFCERNILTYINWGLNLNTVMSQWQKCDFKRI